MPKLPAESESEGDAEGQILKTMIARDHVNGYSKTFPRDFLTFLDFLRIVLAAIV